MADLPRHGGRRSSSQTPAITVETKPADSGGCWLVPGGAAIALLAMDSPWFIHRPRRGDRHPEAPHGQSRPGTIGHTARRSPPDGKYWRMSIRTGLHLQVISSWREPGFLELESGLAQLADVKWYPGRNTTARSLAETGDEPMGLWSVNVLPQWSCASVLQRQGRRRRVSAPTARRSLSSRGRSTPVEQSRTSRSGCRDQTVEDARLIIESGPEESLWNLAWSPDSARLAYGTWGRTVAIKSLPH